MLKVFIGDNTNYLSDLVTRLDSSAYLCTNENYSIKLEGPVYTSLGDLSLKNLHSLVELADAVSYCPPKIWSSDELKEQTHIHLNFLSNKKPIKGFKKIQYNPTYMSVVDSRKTSGQQIWVVGCSFSHGIGVSETERYGNLLGKKLDLPVSFLTTAGTSIKWAANQILRSDIQKQDIVVWGITGSSRFTFLDDRDSLHHVTLINYNNSHEFTQLVDKNFFVSNHMCYESIPYIDQVMKYFESIGNKYILGMFPLNIIEHESKILKYVSQFNNSILLYTDHKFLDTGSDDLHPGVKQHQWYANTILDFYNNKLANK